MMKYILKKLPLIVFALIMSGYNISAFSAESKYEIRADGLACPYCAYGIEKKFMQIKGVKHVDVKLKKGLVLVTGDEQLSLKAPQLKTLFNDAGFTYRSMKKISVQK